MGEILLHPGHPAWGRELRGFIRSQQRCPACKARAWQVKDYGRGRRALTCGVCGNGWASLFEVVVKHQGKQHTIMYDERGQRLTTLPDAELAQEIISRQLDDGSFRPEYWRGAKHNELLWENYFADYLDRERLRVANGEISQATLDKRTSMKKHFKPLKGKNIRDLSQGDIDDFAARLQGPAPKTRHDILSNLQRILDQATARGDLGERKQRIKVPLPKLSWRRPTWMSYEQQVDVAAYVPPEHPIILFIMQYGPRPMEAAALMWKDLDLANRRFAFRRTFTRRKLGKTTKQRRDTVLPIEGWFADWLEESPRGFPDQPVFKNPKAHPSKNPNGFYIGDALNGIWRDILNRAGYDHMRLGNNRHSVGNQLAADGADAGRIADWFGHASTKPARENYLDKNPDTLRSLAKKRTFKKPIPIKKKSKK
jgi:integrase